MACEKRPFATYGMAKCQLRLWQRKSRRTEFDQNHIYRAECVEHRGQYHVGRKHDVVKGNPRLNLHNRGEMYDRIDDELDDLFDNQVTRVHQKLARHAHQRRAQFINNDQGPLVMAESGTLAPAGDQIHVDKRK